MAFVSELSLSNQVLNSHFISEFVDAHVYPTIAMIEPKGLFGIPDLVVANINDSKDEPCILKTYAFEMKLSNWQRALVQAYKYQAFVNLSFVIMDKAFVDRALKQIDKFRLSNIGLISVDQKGFFCVHHFPNNEDPYSTVQKNKFEQMIMKNKLFFSNYSLTYTLEYAQG